MFKLKDVEHLVKLYFGLWFTVKDIIDLFLHQHHFILRFRTLIKDFFLVNYNFILVNYFSLKVVTVLTLSIYMQQVEILCLK